MHPCFDGVGTSAPIKINIPTPRHNLCAFFHSVHFAAIVITLVVAILAVTGEGFDDIVLRRSISVSFCNLSHEKSP
jgi:hypothetical protein